MKKYEVSIPIVWRDEVYCNLIDKVESVGDLIML